jgi:hypothetical protein
MKVLYVKRSRLPEFQAVRVPETAFRPVPVPDGGNVQFLCIFFAIFVDSSGEPLVY